MKNRLYLYLSSISILLLVISSCKKSFLDVPDKGTLLRQAYVIDLQSTGEYLNGIYITLSTNFYHGYNLIYADLVADNIKPVTGSGMFSMQYKWEQQANETSENTPTANTTGMNPMWYIGYRIIRDCSFVIDKAGQYRGENADKADDIKGQAYAIRALVHFMLTNVFAQLYHYTADASHPGIPYVTTSDYTEPVARETVAKVYEYLLDDLSKSLQLLPAAPTNTVAANKNLVLNKNAVKALLARVYLYKEDFLAAKNLAREVGLSVPIMAASSSGYPSKLFTLQETEALFQIAPSSSAVSSGTYSTNFQARYFNSAATTQFLATTDIADLLRQNPSDVRKNWIKSGGAGKDTIIKYPVSVISGFTPTSNSYYQTIIRSSEMYLTAAEAYAKINNEDSARYYLDAIRKRANSSLGATTAVGAALLDSIYVERRKELAFEGLRMFDILRWKKGLVRNDAPVSTAKELPYPSNKAISPIPLRDVLINGLNQNLDY